MRLSLKVVVIVVGLVTLLTSTSFIGLIMRINRQNDEAMLTTAKAIYNNVLITRKWISDHDGVLVKKLPGMHPNPFLPHPLLVTNDGDTLLLKNPALVTRELSMLSGTMGREFEYHLASEKYLNPINKPDSFEETALHYFSQDRVESQDCEYFRMEKRDGKNFFRYFAPLYVQQSCLSCHDNQNYKVGDLRGGISVLVSADRHLADRRSNIYFMLGLAVVSIILLSVLIYYSLQHSIIKPLKQMEHQADKFEEGNYAFNLNIANQDEIGKLAHSFQNMGQRIKLYTNRLRKSEEKYRRIIENSPEAVVIIDSEGKIIECNENFVELSGISTGDLENQNLYEMLEINHKSRLGKQQRINNESPAGDNRFEAVFKSHNSDDVPVEVTITSGISIGDKYNPSFVYLHDLSEQKQIEKTSLQTEKMYALGRLSAGIAHEIRNPLFALNNNLDFLKSKLDESDELTTVFPELKDSAERIGSIISTVLDYARHHSSKMEPVDLNLVIQHSMSLIGKHLDRVQIKSMLELEKHLPTIKGDPHQLDQVIINLAMNAIQAIDCRGSLIIKTQSNQQKVEFIVEDTGSGIAPEDLDRIFDPFFTKSHGGTGLGLAVTQRILDNHNAIYKINSELNVGTRFTVWFPIWEKTR